MWEMMKGCRWVLLSRRSDRPQMLMSPKINLSIGQLGEEESEWTVIGGFCVSQMNGVQS